MIGYTPNRKDALVSTDRRNPPHPLTGPTGIALSLILGIIAANTGAWLYLNMRNLADVGTACWIAVFGGGIACIAAALGAFAVTHRD